MIVLASKVRWTSDAPAIYLTYEYEKQRLGANMQYRAKITVSTVTGSSTFGFPIYASVTIDGDVAGSATIKAANPSQWSSELTYTTPWVTVENKTSGTTPISFRVYSGSGSSRNQTNAYTMAVDPAASQLAAQSGVLGEEQILSITRYDESFLDTITYTCQGVTGTVTEDSTASEVAFTPPLSLAEQNLTGASVAITLTVTSKNADDGSIVGTSSITVSAAIPESVKPTATLTVSDDTTYKDIYGAYVQSMSVLVVNVDGQPTYGAPIQGYSISADGKNFSAQSAMISPINGSGNLIVAAKVTDTRGRQSDTATEQISVLPYQTPKISNVSIIRCEQDGTQSNAGGYIKVTFAASVSPLNNKNTAAYTVQFREKSDVELPFSSENVSQYDGVYEVSGEYIFEAPSSAGYDVQLVATDSFGSTIRAAAAQVSSGKMLMHFLSDKSGGAIGKQAEKPNVLDVAWNLLVRGSLTVDGEFSLTDTLAKQIALAAHPVGSLYWSKDPTSPAELFGGKWKQIKDTFILAAGDTYAAGNVGGSADAVVVAHTHTASGIVNINTGTSSGVPNGAYYSFKYGEITTDETGESGVGKNMPPYVAYYCWERLSDDGTELVVSHDGAGHVTVSGAASVSHDGNGHVTMTY